MRTPCRTGNLSNDKIGSPPGFCNMSVGHDLSHCVNMILIFRPVEVRRDISETKVMLFVNPVRC